VDCANCVFAGRGLFGISAKAGFRHIPLTAHTYGLIPLAEFTKVVGVPGSGDGGGGGVGVGGDGGGGGGGDDGYVSLQPAKITAVANKSPRDDPMIFFLLRICDLFSILWIQLC
jgi:hypothetical protein